MKLSWTGIALLCTYLALTPSTTIAAPLPIDDPTSAPTATPVTAEDCVRRAQEWLPLLKGKTLYPDRPNSLDPFTLDQFKATFPRRQIVLDGGNPDPTTYSDRLVIQIDQTCAIEAVSCG